MRKVFQKRKRKKKKEKKKGELCTYDDDEKKVLFQKGTEECETILIFSELHK
jgi:hypothetical protein